MASARAHTFILQARLAISLAWVAGFVNVVAIVACGEVVSHVTGHASALGKLAADGDWTVALVPAALIGAFFFGALCSGLSVEFARQRGWSSIYVLPASLELALLAVFALLELRGGGHAGTDAAPDASQWWMTVVASIAMGLQNATITRISSGVVRTTHLTGVVTDLGHESAQFLVTRALSGRVVFSGVALGDGPGFQRLFLLASIAGSFVLGSACGALSERCIGHLGMIPPMLLLAWIVLADIRTPICAIEPALLAEADLSEFRRELPGIAVYRAIPRGQGGSEVHLPDLAAWIAGLPSETRVAVLDLGRVRVFGPLGASALESMYSAASRRGLKVVVAGVEDIEAATVNALTRANLLHAGNFAKDVPRALAMLSAPRENDA